MRSKAEQAELLVQKLKKLESEIADLQEERRDVERQIRAIFNDQSADVDEEDEVQDLGAQLSKSSPAYKLLEMLKENPQLDYYAAAKKIYGEKDGEGKKGYQKIAATLTFLQKKGKVRKGQVRGRWEPL